jgi:hypothetical protein
VQTLSQLQIEIEIWLFILGCLISFESRPTHSLYLCDYETVTQTQMEVAVGSNSSVLLLLECFFPHCFYY